jgi:hypothetical protein
LAAIVMAWSPGRERDKGFNAKTQGIARRKEERRADPCHGQPELRPDNCTLVPIRAERLRCVNKLPSGFLPPRHGAALQVFAGSALGPIALNVSGNSAFGRSGLVWSAPAKVNGRKSRPLALQGRVPRSALQGPAPRRALANIPGPVEKAPAGPSLAAREDYQGPLQTLVPDRSRPLAPQGPAPRIALANKRSRMETEPAGGWREVYIQHHPRLPGARPLGPSQQNAVNNRRFAAIRLKERSKSDHHSVLYIYSTLPPAP